MHRSRTSQGAVVRSSLLACALAACGASPASAPALAEPRCPTEQTVVLASQADVARFASCTTAHGVVIRSGGKLDTSPLRALATITGDLVIGPTVAVEEVTLGELRVIGGTLRVVGNGALQGLFLPRLERAGQIEIEGNVAATTISLPRLAEVRGALRVTDNASLELLDIPALTSIDHELVLSGVPTLLLVEAAQLQRAGAIRIDAPKLAPDVADRLRASGAAP